jgi:hypothetical protein
MRKRQRTRNIVYRATLLGLLTILAACGGGDKKEEPPPCTSNIIVLIICSILSTDSPVPNEGPVSANDSRTRQREHSVLSRKLGRGVHRRGIQG